MGKRNKTPANCLIQAILKAHCCIVRLHLNKENTKKKENPTEQSWPQNSGGREGEREKKELFTEESSHTGVVPAAHWARLAANIQLLVTFISYRALLPVLLLLLRRQRLFLGL